MFFSRFVRTSLLAAMTVFVGILCPLPSAQAQASSATLAVSVTDSTGAAIPQADLVVRNTATDQSLQLRTKESGAATFSFLKPGTYQLTVSKQQFADVVVNSLVLNVGDNRHLDVRLKVGADTQTISVDGSGITLNTIDASVGTVVDRNFVKNMPLNGRSFQDLISMTPGVVTQTPQVTAYIQSNGDFSVNGQRTESNYYTVDGVSANIGAGNPTAGGQNATSGSISGSTALGTTQSLISVDALQEFRVSSSSYSAEFGRTPGGQFSLVSRSGTNSFHGTVFDYLRNDVFDANDWFNANSGLRKTALRQNDFGGTLGGPLTIPRVYSGRDRSFFFVSYEGLRLDQPTAATTLYVPSLTARTVAAAAVQPLLKAFPLPTGSEIQLSGSPSGLAPFIMPYSLPGSINSTSLRLDQRLSSRVSIFFRYGYTPTYTSSRVLSTLYHSTQNATTFTGGIDALFGKDTANSLRVGYAKSLAQTQGELDNFAGATPTSFHDVMGFPATTNTYYYDPYLSINGVGQTTIAQENALIHDDQWNITDTVAKSLGHHQLKLGIDQRRISSALLTQQQEGDLYYYSVASMKNNAADYGYIYKTDPSYPVFQEFSAFVQDDWRVAPSLSLSGGLRWEVNPAPTAADGRMPYTVYGNPEVPSSLTLAPRGTSLWNTTWFNLAPRLGVAWIAHSTPGHETVLRAGGGVFFDTGNQAAGVAFSGLGFFNYTSLSNTTAQFPATAFNFTTAAVAPYTSSTVAAYPRHLQLPYTLQWNASLDQSLGQHQVLTISYVASAGRRLLEEQARNVTAQNSNFGNVYYYPNGFTSNYQALQLRFQRSVAHGLQALASYTWGHSLDYGSTSISYPFTYGNSDFDVRNNMQAGLTWDLPHFSGKHFTSALTRNWGLDGRVNVRSGFPITILGRKLVDASLKKYYTGVNYNPLYPIYLYGKQYPGGRTINGGPSVSSSTAAFTLPAAGTTGNAARNFVRGFGADQVNVALRREFHLKDTASLQFRAETFNVFNHPNFGYIDPTITDALFGQTTKMLNSSLGGMSSLYQQGGPRSMQFSLHLAF